ncbi:hypothetical protein ACMFMG_002573 [Clarireedia jacksonii]
MVFVARRDAFRIRLLWDTQSNAVLGIRTLPKTIQLHNTSLLLTVYEKLGAGLERPQYLYADLISALCSFERLCRIFVTTPLLPVPLGLHERANHICRARNLALVGCCEIELSSSYGCF